MEQPNMLPGARKGYSGGYLWDLARLCVGLADSALQGPHSYCRRSPPRLLGKFSDLNSGMAEVYLSKLADCSKSLLQAALA